MAETQGARSVKLNPGHMLEAEYNQQRWIVTTEPGTTVSDVLEPNYWFHVARTMQPYAHIEVRDVEGKWVCFLMAINTGLNWASCIMLSQHNLAEVAAEPPEAQRFTVKWISPQSKYGVLRNADGKTLQAGFPAKSDAYAWAATNDAQLNI